MTVAGPTATITQRWHDERQAAEPMKRGLTETICDTNPAAARVTQGALVEHHIAKRDETITISVTDSSYNWCGYSGYPECVSTILSAYVESLVYTTTEDSTSYDYVTSTYHTTVTSYYFVTSITADGYTTTVNNDNDSTLTSDNDNTPTGIAQTSTSESDVTVVNTGTEMVTATAIATGGGSSESEVVVTNRQTDIATATAAAAEAAGNRLLPHIGSRTTGSLGMILWQALLYVI